MGNPYLAIVIFALVALFLVFKLRSVLGRRTGTERPPVPYGTQNPGHPSRPSATVIDLHANAPGAGVSGEPSITAGLSKIRAADPKFQPASFLQGAAQAFPMIVKAFADGDTATLRRLTSDEVYDTFAEIIRKRLAAREAALSRILRLDPPVILGATLEGRTARIDLKFVSSQIFALQDQAGNIVEGDPDQPIERTDIWSFARNTRSLDPNWMLIATASGD